MKVFQDSERWQVATHDYLYDEELHYYLWDAEEQKVWYIDYLNAGRRRLVKANQNYEDGPHPSWQMGLNYSPMPCECHCAECGAAIYELHYLCSTCERQASHR